MDAVKPVLASCDFKGWSLIVWARLPGLQWPPRCACCLKTGPSWIERRDGDRSLRIPLCEACHRHSRMDTVAGLAALGGAVPLTGFLHFMIWGLKVPTGLGLVATVDVILFFVCAIAVYAPFRFFLPGRSKACADTGWPVGFRSVPSGGSPGKGNGERQDDYQLRMLLAKLASEAPDAAALEFTSKAYAAEFMAQNGGAPVQVRIAAKG